MGLYQQIEIDVKAAMKSGDQMRLSTLRMLLSSLRMIEIERNVKTIDDADVLQTIRRQCKQRVDSIDQFTNGNRPDLAEKERRELTILEGYLPRQLTDAELTEIIRAVIAKTGAVSKKDAGRVMKAAMETLKGAADGKAVNRIAMGLLP